MTLVASLEVLVHECLLDFGFGATGGRVGRRATTLGKSLQTVAEKQRRGLVLVPVNKLMI